MDAERIFDAFGLTEDERAWIRADEDGYRAARAAAAAEEQAFREEIAARIAAAEDRLRWRIQADVINGESGARL